MAGSTVSVCSSNKKRIILALSLLLHHSWGRDWAAGKGANLEDLAPRLPTTYKVPCPSKKGFGVYNHPKVDGVWGI